MMMSLQTDDAVYAYREAKEARECASRLEREARNALLDVLGVKPQYSTLARTADEREPIFRKSDVDTVPNHLTPSQRKRLRNIKLSLKGAV